MALNIRSRKVNELAGELAAKLHVTKTEAVRIALENELRRSEENKTSDRRSSSLGKV